MAPRRAAERGALTGVKSAAATLPPDTLSYVMPVPKFCPKVFISYSHRDRELKEKFDTNLQVLSEQGEIQCWTDGQILPGDHWPDEITEAMNNADLIIFMVSNNFLASSFIRRKEAPMAMMRVNKGKAVIVPVILTKTPGWQKEEWNTLQALPSEVRPVDHPEWGKPENAFADVEEELRKLIGMLPQKLAKQSRQWEEATQTGSTVAPGMEHTPPVRTPQHGRPWFSGAAVAVTLLLGFAVWYMARPPAPAISPEPQVPASAISPELRAWIDDPKVNRIAKVSAWKGNGYIQNGLQELSTGTEKVAAQRVHQRYVGDENRNPVFAENGICMVFAINWIGAPVTKPIMFVVYFNAERAGDPKASPGSIKIDPNSTPGPVPCAGIASEVAPGFSYRIINAVDKLSPFQGHLTAPPHVFTGPHGDIPGGTHRVAMELLIENQPIWRGVFDLIVRPLIYAQSHKDWVRGLAVPKVDVSLVANSVTRPASDTLQWKVLLKGDANRLDEPITLQCYYFAQEVGSEAPERWTVNPREDPRINFSKEIEGMNRLESAWGNSLSDWKDGSFEHPSSFTAVPEANLPQGRMKSPLKC